jgi:hypothetical protein
MRKHNFAGSVNTITPHPREAVRSVRLSISVLGLVAANIAVKELLDPQGVGM